MLPSRCQLSQPFCSTLWLLMLHTGRFTHVGAAIGAYVRVAIADGMLTIVQGANIKTDKHRKMASGSVHYLQGSETGSPARFNRFQYMLAGSP